MADAGDLKSLAQKACGFDSRPGHFMNPTLAVSARLGAGVYYKVESTLNSRTVLANSKAFPLLM